MSSFHFCLSAARNLSSFQLLPASLMTDLLQLFLGLPLFVLPWGFHSRAAFGISPSFLSVWPIHLSFLFLISKFISSWPVTFHKSLLEMTFGHHILKMYLRHLLTKVCILHQISLVTSHVSHPYKSTDFTQALKILILVPFHISVDSHTLLSLENDPLAKWNYNVAINVLKEGLWQWTCTGNLPSENMKGLTVDKSFFCK